MVSSTPRPHFTSGKDTVPILQEAGWAPGLVWTCGKSHPHRDSIPDRPARNSGTTPTELPGPQAGSSAPAKFAASVVVWEKVGNLLYFEVGVWT